MKSHVTPNHKRQLSGQSPEEGMGASIPEARHQSPASSEDSSKTDLLHLGSGRGRKEVCSLDWEEKNQVRIHALIVTTRVSKQKELRHRQESIITRAHRPEEPADIQRVKTVKGVTGSPNKKGTGQTPTKMISPNLERVKKETLSQLGSDILTSQGQGCLAMSKLTTGFHREIQRRSPGRGRSAGMHEDLRILAWDNPPRVD
ncbi:hypothetical protein Tco_0916153 [Tanacetum coccineum]